LFIVDRLRVHNLIDRAVEFGSTRRTIETVLAVGAQKGPFQAEAVSQDPRHL